MNPGLWTFKSWGLFFKNCFRATRYKAHQQRSWSTWFKICLISHKWRPVSLGKTYRSLTSRTQWKKWWALNEKRLKTKVLNLKLSISILGMSLIRIWNSIVQRWNLMLDVYSKLSWIYSQMHSSLQPRVPSSMWCKLLKVSLTKKYQRIRHFTSRSRLLTLVRVSKRNSKANCSNPLATSMMANS